MGRQRGGKRPLSYAFNLDDHVPAEHLLRGIDRFLGLGELHRHLARFCSHTGRPSVDPELIQKLEKIPGIGSPGAGALVASIADARSFDNERQVSAGIGVVPRQHSRGGKPTLPGISKRGDVYPRTLLIHGARSAIGDAQRRATVNPRLAGLLHRRNPNIAAVALANRNARTAWAPLAHGGELAVC